MESNYVSQYMVSFFKNFLVEMEVLTTIMEIHGFTRTRVNTMKIAPNTQMSDSMR